MTLFEELSIFAAFCMIYGMGCVIVGVMYGSRNNKKQRDVDSGRCDNLSCGDRTRCVYNGRIEPMDEREEYPLGYNPYQE